MDGSITSKRDLISFFSYKFAKGYVQMTFITKVENEIEHIGLISDQLHDVNETGLNCKLSVTKTFATCKEVSALGRKLKSNI